MTNAVTEIRELERSEWRILRDIRLRALRDSPHAFTSHYDCEVQLPEHAWRRRCDRGRWVVAHHGDEAIGMTGLVDGDPGEPRHLEGIWVAAQHRRRQVFSRLLDRVIEIARLDGLDWLPLWVLEDNAVAMAAYVRRGFVWRGKRQPLDQDGCRVERRLWLPI